MRRHPLADIAFIFLDQLQRMFGIEFLHDDAGAAQRLHRDIPAQRRGMIERRGRQVDAVLVKAENGFGQYGNLVGRRNIFLQRQGQLDALGLAGGAG